MKSLVLAVLFAGVAPSMAGTLLFSDNFNTADTDNFDDAPLEGRLSGLAASETSLRSAGSQQDIAGNRLDLDAAGGLRFGGQVGRYNWAGSTTGAEILGAGGFQVAFDWSHNGNSPDWIAWSVGTPNNDNNVNDAGVDHSILIRQGDGGLHPTVPKPGQFNERFDNGSNLGYSGVSHNPVTNVFTTYSVVLTYTFSSFADGAPVNLKAAVNGIQIVNDNFTWDGNGGALHMELKSGAEGSFVDNLAISAVPEPSVTLLGLGGMLATLLRRRR